MGGREKAQETPSMAPYSPPETGTCLFLTSLLHSEVGTLKRKRNGRSLQTSNETRRLTLCPQVLALAGQQFFFSFFPFFLQGYHQKGRNEFSTVLQTCPLSVHALPMFICMWQGSNEARFPLRKSSLCTQQQKDSLSFSGKWPPRC